MLNKTRGFLLVLLIVFIVLAGVAYTNYIQKNEKEKLSADEYVTITYSRNISDDVNSPIVNEFWHYDTTTLKKTKVFETEYTSQYPLGFYDEKNKRIYYTKRLDSKNSIAGDQIFMTDLNTHRETQLTDNLFAVNNLYAVNNLVFFVAKPIGASILKLGLLNIENGEINYWGDEDKSVAALTVDKVNKRIYLSTYSEKERKYNLLHQDGPVGQNNFKMPVHTVYETDFSFKHTKELFTEEEWIRTILTKDNYIIALSDKEFNTQEIPSNITKYNLSDNSLSKSKWNTHRLQVGDANYSYNGNEIFTISTIGNKRGLYSYNVKSNEFIEIFTPETGFVNNIQVVK